MRGRRRRAQRFTGDGRIDDETVEAAVPNSDQVVVTEYFDRYAALPQFASPMTGGSVTQGVGFQAAPSASLRKSDDTIKGSVR